MRLIKIEIENYKSIKEMDFDFISYGSGSNKSNTAFLLGINESGKTNLLNAIYCIGNGIEGSYENVCYKEAQEDNGDVWIHATYQVLNNNDMTEVIQEDDNFPDSLTKAIKIKTVGRELLLESDESSHDIFSIELDSFNCEKYQITPSNLITEIETEIDEGNELLSFDKLKSLIKEKVTPYIEANYPEITLWKSDASYLITEQISLTAFIANADISIPLQNMFYIYGKTDLQDMFDTIQTALKSAEKKAELVAKMSSVVTKHVNKIWKEHKVNFKFAIDGDLMNIVIEDKQNEFKYYNMKQRSEGFKQFVSLILSLSAKNSGELLQNNVILIDEPETHLHPSGIQYMRKELLKIGKKNQMLISTHSNFMIDTTTMERHWIVEKNENSIITQIDDFKSLHDEEVVSRAFGIEIMKELVPKNVILVEGKCDKIVLELVLKHFSNSFNYSIKSAGGCSKVYSIASILAAEDFKPIVFLDSDDEGVKAKKDILKNLKDNYDTNSVKTISDLNFSKVNKASIEDLYPRDFVKQYFIDNYNIDIDTHSTKPVIETIKILDDSFKNKEKQTKVKIELSTKFEELYNDKTKLETDASDLVDLAKEFLKCLEQ
jgi:predicted ATP-dependent endonuclease of OLD family